jgi:class 3 adenylate cyclase
MSLVADDAVEAGRAALERHAWQEAYETLSNADRAGSLSAEGLFLLADSAWWSGHPEDVIDALERAYGAYTKEGDPSSAAMIAFRLAEQHGMRGELAQTQAWMSRAERLASDLPEGPVHGWLEWIRGLISFGDVDTAINHYDQAIEIARRLGDPNLYGMSLHDKGHLLCMQGKVAEGLALMDEVMVAAVGGEMGPLAAGYVYCGMIGICTRLTDYGRAAEWTAATTRWCERHSISAFPGVCRVHRAQVWTVRGEWTKAEEEARTACEELPRYNMLPGLGFANYEIGEVRRQMGDLAAAEEAYTTAHQYGRSPHPGLALTWLMQGKVDSAAAAVREALAEAVDDRLARIKLLAAQAEIAVAAGDVDLAARAADELEGMIHDYETPARVATAAYVRGIVRLAQGDAGGALGDLRRARKRWIETGAPYEAARAGVLMARTQLALGDRDGAALEAKTAREAFERLGAHRAAEEVTRLLGDLDLSAGRTERVRRTFMFTDIVKSTDLVAAIGDDAWEDLLSWHDLKLRSLFTSHGGEVVHHTGDGFFVAFQDAEAAIGCAVGIQRALADHRRSQGFAPQVRIGVHAAEATRRGNDYGGGEVHKAARIAAAAGGGDIFASADTVSDSQSGVSISEPEPLTLKGIAEPVPIVRIDWRASSLEAPAGTR